MEQLHAIHIKELQQERRFKETLRLRNELLAVKLQIEEAEKECNQADKELNKLEPQVYKMDLEVKTLGAERDDMEKHIRGRIMDVLNLEEALKQSKTSFQNNMRQSIEMVYNLVKEESSVPSRHSTVTDEAQNDETMDIRRQVWALEGEIKAMTFYEEFQRKKIEEIEKIKQVVGKPFQGDTEENLKRPDSDEEIR